MRGAPPARDIPVPGSEETFTPNGGASPSGAPQARAVSRRRNSRPAGRSGAVTSDAPAVHSSSWRRDAGPPASHTDACGVEIALSGKPAGQPWVFVVSRTKEPLGLAHPAVARIWRNSGKARMHRVGVNVVRITCRHAQECFIRKSRGTRADIGVDPGAKTSGLTLAVDGAAATPPGGYTARAERQDSAGHPSPARGDTPAWNV